MFLSLCLGLSASLGLSVCLCLSVSLSPLPSPPGCSVLCLARAGVRDDPGPGVPRGVTGETQGLSAVGCGVWGGRRGRGGPEMRLSPQLRRGCRQSSEKCDPQAWAQGRGRRENCRAGVGHRETLGVRRWWCEMHVGHGGLDGELPQIRPPSTASGASRAPMDKLP